MLGAHPSARQDMVFRAATRSSRWGMTAASGNILKSRRHICDGVDGCDFSVLSGAHESRCLSFVCAFSAGWLIATFVTPLNDMLGGGSEAVGFRRTMMIFAAMSVVLYRIDDAKIGHIERELAQRR